MQISPGSYHVLAVLSTRPTRSYWVLFRTWWEPDATTFILNMSKVNVEVHDFLLPFQLLLGPYCVSTGSSVRLWSSHYVYNSFSQISERSKIFVVKRECVIGVLARVSKPSKFEHVLAYLLSIKTKKVWNVVAQTLKGGYVKLSLKFFFISDCNCHVKVLITVVSQSKPTWLCREYQVNLQHTPRSASQ